MRLAIVLHIHLIEIDDVTGTAVIVLQSASVYSAKFYTPERDCFAANSDTWLREQIFNIAVAQVAAKVQPGGVGNDVGRESVPFVCIHVPIISISML